jgi:hypothetical protein|nr:MAG TPA: hypothetical protein [Caudoviricetes sp.]
MVHILKVRVMIDSEPLKTVHPTEQVFATVEAAREFFKSEYKTEKVIMYYEQR